MAAIPSIQVFTDWRLEESQGRKCDNCECVIHGPIYRLYFTVADHTTAEGTWLCCECADNPH